MWVFIFAFILISASWESGGQVAKRGLRGEGREIFDTSAKAPQRKFFFLNGVSFERPEIIITITSNVRNQK